MLLEHANEAIVVSDLDGTIVEVNERWRETLGIPTDELLRRNFYHLGESERDRDAIRAAVCGGGGKIGPIAFPCTDGGTVLMMLSVTVVDVDAGQLVLSIGNDVTHAMRLERRYGTLVERIPDVIWTTSTKDGTTFFTPNAAKLFGESLTSLSAAPVAARIGRIHPDDSERVAEAFQTYFDQGATFDIEYRYRRRDGRWLWLRERTFPLTERDGREVGEGMISDVTERKSLEDDLRQSQKMEALGQLTGGIAHDFNNILATILTNAQFLADAIPEGDPRRDDANAIYEAGERAATLTRHLLAFSRRQILEPRIVELNTAVVGVQRMLRSLIRENILFNFVPGETAGNIRIDLGQLEQVIMNLVLNACDAMPAGGDLTIETDFTEETNEVLLRVRDNGHGMDEGTMRRIFEPFFTTKEMGRGTGLGLSTCYGIVQQSGGRILVDSTVGVGTVFTIALPRVDEKPGSAPRLEPNADVAAGTETILLLEDDHGVRTVVKRLLEARGYRVLVADGPSEAIDLTTSTDVDLVLSDVIMPEMSGPVLVKRIREHTPDVKVIYISGYTDQRGVGATIPPGARVVEKPFRPGKLVGAIQAELQQCSRARISRALDSERPQRVPA